MDRSQSDARLLARLESLCSAHNRIRPELYDRYDVKRGLRNSDGTGVLVGLTEIGSVHGYIIDEKEKVPVEGTLRYRGISIKDLVEGYRREERFGYEEVCYLLLFGALPDPESLEHFTRLLDDQRELPPTFTEDMILKAPSRSVMNKLARSVLASYSYDTNPDDLAVANVLRQSIQLIARFPTMAAYGYQAKAHYHDSAGLFIHSPKPGLSTAENFLRLIRQDASFTQLEARVLDLCLILHAEHGGGNNSAFAVHVVSSTDTDTYSAIAAAVSSLKGWKHGGANLRVFEMMEDLKAAVRDPADDQQVTRYIRLLLEKKAFDRSGLVYGMGHPVYTLSDPRSVILKSWAAELAREKGREDDFRLYETFERLVPPVFREVKDDARPLCANVDFYSGLVYSMLNIPHDLYTIVFAVGRIAGWCAHRLEEIISGGRIIRPAYKDVARSADYVPLHKRQPPASAPA